MSYRYVVVMITVKLARRYMFSVQPRNQNINKLERIIDIFPIQSLRISGLHTGIDPTATLVFKVFTMPKILHLRDSLFV